MSDCRITFHPGDHQVVVAEGTDLLTAALVAGVRVRSECGGEGVCGDCKLIVRDGVVDAEAGGRISGDERQAGYVLACRTAVRGDVVVEIPLASQTETQRILTEADDRRQELFGRVASVQKAGVVLERAAFAPTALATKVFLQLPAPTAADNISDVDRLFREIRQTAGIADMQMGLSNVRQLPQLLRTSNWQVTVTLGQRDGTTEVVLVEPGDTSARNFAVVIDVGTTTVVASLVDLVSREILGTKGTLNPQSSYGEDVISRIIYAEREEGLQRMHLAVVGPINQMIGELVEESGIGLNQVTSVVCAGNTTMTHLLLRLNPSYIRRSPYVPAARQSPVIRAGEAGIQIHPRGLLACLAGVSSFVGGDITAGVLATGLDDAEEPCMLIDLGTNGEIVMGNRDWLVCCSASAGPAFEGGGVRCGTLAVDGAVQRVRVDREGEDVEIETIGGHPPVGICGSGYIDLLAELLRSGLVDRQGRLRPDGAGPRVRRGEDGAEFVVAWAADSADSRDIVITQLDIESLIRSKGAIFSAARVLVKSLSHDFGQIHRIYIGGGFGTYLNIEKSIWIGLLPDLPLERFEFMGNTSLAGARMALLSSDAMARAHEIGDKMTNIELCDEPSYMDEYVGSLFLPHTDIGLFPTVRESLEGVAQ